MPVAVLDAVARRRPAPAALLRPLLVVLAALVAGALTAAPAGAHDSLVSSDPADGAVLGAPPATVTLEFSGEVIPTGTQVVVTDASGAPVDAGAPEVAGTQVVAALPADLPAGAYTVAWRVVSSDGHPIEGALGFTLEGAASPSPSAAASSGAASSAAAPSGAASSAAAPTPSATSSAAAGPAAGTHAGHEGGGVTGPWVVLGLLALLVAGGTAAVTAARRRAAISQAARREDGAAER